MRYFSELQTGNSKMRTWPPQNHCVKFRLGLFLLDEYLLYTNFFPIEIKFRTIMHLQSTETLKTEQFLRIKHIPEWIINTLPYRSTTIITVISYALKKIIYKNKKHLRKKNSYFIRAYNGTCNLRLWVKKKEIHAHIRTNAY